MSECASRMANHHVATVPESLERAPIEVCAPHGTRGGRACVACRCATLTCGAQTSRGARSKLSGTVAKWWFAIREARSLTHPPAL